MKMWKEMDKYEMKSEPDEGENVQYVAIHVLRFSKIVKALGLKDDSETVSFFLREKE